MEWQGTLQLLEGADEEPRQRLTGGVQQAAVDE